MPTTPLVTRAGLGRALTWAEGDSNVNVLETRTGAGWNDLPAEVIVPAGGANIPTWSNFRDGLYGWAFSPTTMNECWANFHIRHDYDSGGGNTPGMVYPHVHVSSNVAASGVVRWGYEYTAARRDDNNTPGNTTFGATTTIYFERTVTVGEVYAHWVAEAQEGQGIPLATDLMVDSLILARIFRDATHPNDTFPESVFVFAVDIHYPCDVLSTPNRQYPFT